MSATLADDSILVSHYNVNHEIINEAITPTNCDDIGDRMILVPQEINPDITDDQLKGYYQELSKSHNVVVLVPSIYRASFWEDVADKIIRAKELHEGVEELKTKHVGLVVIINKYDGIDLPKSACRVLIIDGLPDVRRKIDKIEQSILQGSEELLTKTVQRIEQGMGRGVRSKEDYCVVFLMGRSLVDKLYVEDALSKFTPATKAQITLSENLSKQIRGKGLDELKQVVNYSLTRNTDWVKASKGALVHIKYNPLTQISETVIKEREAFNYAAKKNYPKASEIMLDVVNKQSNIRVKGYLKQKLAEYINFYDEVESQQTLMSAVDDNNQVLHPIEGIRYSKLVVSNHDQAREIVGYIKNKFGEPNKYILSINRLVEQLVFMPDTSSTFEQAVKELASYLGFKGQRPEAEFNKGPDVLWAVGNLKYFVIECKNGAVVDSISKQYCNQLNGSVNWFYKKYDHTCQLVPILIHPSHKFDYSASPHQDIRIMQENKLALLKENLLQFAKSVATDPYNIMKIDELLNNYGFKENQFIQKYTVKYTQ